MALLTVENQQATAMNELDSLSGGSGVAALNATGGARKDPLPHPFDWVVLGANGSATDSKQLAIHPADFRYMRWLGDSLEPRDEWNRLVQEGKVTMAYAAQTDSRDQEEAFSIAIY